MRVHPDAHTSSTSSTGPVGTSASARSLSDVATEVALAPEATPLAGLGPTVSKRSATGIRPTSAMRSAIEATSWGWVREGIGTTATGRSSH